MRSRRTAASMFAVIETTVGLGRYELALVAAQEELVARARRASVTASAASQAVCARYRRFRCDLLDRAVARGGRCGPAAPAGAAPRRAADRHRGRAGRG